MQSAPQIPISNVDAKSIIHIKLIKMDRVARSSGIVYGYQGKIQQHTLSVACLTVVYSHAML